MEVAMKIIIKNREMMEDIHLASDTAVISVRDEDRPLVQGLRAEYLTELALPDIAKRQKGADSMPASKAQQIAWFVKKLPASVTTLIVHCENGVSRSPGIGAGIIWALGTPDDFWDFIARHRSYDSRCAKMVARALQVQ